MTVRIGLFGTSWWADSMYLPALVNSGAEVVSICGRRESTAVAMAQKWNIPNHFTATADLLDGPRLDAIIVATANDSHFPISMTALDRGLHVLCEKPLGLNVAEAEAMHAKAVEMNAITMVPFTYRYMPAVRWLKRLLDDGYVGRPLHTNLRYYTGFASNGEYSWRFDQEIAGSGLIGDIGSHWIDMARWLLDDTETSVSAVTRQFVERDERPDGSDYTPLEDSAALTLEYASGAYAMVHVSAVCWESTPFGQTHHIEVHGDAGTLYLTCDWDQIQQVTGVRHGDDGGKNLLSIPGDLLDGVRTDSMHNTYRDVFRTTNAMTRGWVKAIAANELISPSFADGLAVQRVIDAATQSAAEKRMVTLS